jgi:hypothetical protein
VIAFTDDDTVPRRDWLEQGERAMQGGVAAAWGHVQVPIPAIPTDYEATIKRLEGAEFVTANCFVRRDALERIAGFDERFTRAWREDSDLYFSLIESGATVTHAPDAVVLHPVRSASWGVSLRQQANSFFDALLYKKHPSLYRAKIGVRPPLLYYVIVLAALAALLAAALDRPQLAAAAVILWMGATAAFCIARLRGTASTPRHVLEMIVTSIGIPFLAIAWRVAGAMRFRVLFA